MSYRRLKRILKRLGGPSSDDEDDGEDLATAKDATSAQLRRLPSSNFLEDLSQSGDLEAAGHGNVGSSSSSSSTKGVTFSASAPAAASSSAKESLIPTEELIAQVERAFFDVLDDDIRRINAHSAKTLAKIEAEVRLLDVRSSGRGGQVHATPLSRLYRTNVGGIDVKLLREQYCMCSKLRSFATINHEGIRKIVKKYDKVVGADKKAADKPRPRQPQILERLSTEPFASSHAEALREAASKLEHLCTPDQLVELRETVSSLSFIHGGGRSSGELPPPVAIGLACALGTCMTLVPLGGGGGEEGADDVAHAQRCLALLVGVVTLWLTEALPYFATSLLVPVGVIACDVIPMSAVPSPLLGHHATRSEAAKFVLNAMFDKTIILVLSGLVAASVVARCSLERRVAVWMQRALGKRPRLFLLVLMQMGLLLSMCISNVTAPILLLSVVTPVLHELPSSCSYSRALLLGLAFSCNLGGMLTPISSPQNAVALEALEAAAHEEISYGEWLALALPLVESAIFALWLLLLRLQPCDVHELPALHFSPTPLKRTQALMLACVALTVLGWALFSVLPPLKATLGDPALLGLVLVGTAFGSGFLTKTDFNGLSWHLLALIAGGNALGLAVSKSGLLRIAAEMLTENVLGGASAWVVAVELSLALLLLTCFISHTVAAIVVMPLAASIGATVGDARGVVFSCALAVSSAMALPMSSFPNVNSLLAEDDYGVPFLSAREFVSAGAPATALVGTIVAALAYPLATLLPE